MRNAISSRGPDILLHHRAAQVQVPIFQPQLLGRVGPVLDDERRRLGARQEFQARCDDLDIAGRRVGSPLLLSPQHLALDRDHVLAPRLRRESDGFDRTTRLVEDDLDGAAAVAPRCGIDGADGALCITQRSAIFTRCADRAAKVARDDESIYAARNDQAISFDQIPNVSAGGIFNDGFQKMYLPGQRDSGYASDTTILDRVILPGRKGLWRLRPTPHTGWR